MDQEKNTHTTLKPLTDERHNNYYLIIMQCSAGKPSGPRIHPGVTLTQTTHVNIVTDQTPSRPPHGTPRRQQPQPAGQCAATLQKTAQKGAAGRSTRQRAQGFDSASNSPGPNPIKHVGYARRSQIHGGPQPQNTQDPKDRLPTSQLHRTHPPPKHLCLFPHGSERCWRHEGKGYTILGRWL